MFQYSPYALLTVLALIVSVWMMIAVWSRRPGQGVNIFVMMTFGLVIWTSSSVISQISTEFAWKTFFTNLTFLGIVIVPASWFAFVQDYTGKTQWLTRRKALLLSIEPVLVMFFIFTNPAHNIFWASRETCI